MTSISIVVSIKRIFPTKILLNFTQQKTLQNICPKRYFLNRANLFKFQVEYMRSLQDIYDQTVAKREILERVGEDPQSGEEELSAKDYVSLQRKQVRGLENLAKARQAIGGKQKIELIDDSPEQPSELGPISEAERDDDGDVSGTVSNTESIVPGTVSLDERPKRRNSFRSETNSK